jgi:SAM-dependent methyltransferase
MEAIGSGAGYALGHSRRELERLTGQATMFGPFTSRMLQQAGLSSGMRVLDVGSGAGDVAFLCEQLVGPSGEVTGIDKAHAAVETANQRARRAGLENVKFIAGDLSQISFETPFDAVVGRLVLMHQPDPVATLRRLARMVGQGGFVAFQEFDITGARSYPPAPMFEKSLEWILAAFSRAGTDTRMGLKLYSTFIAAGLPAPAMSLDAGIWGGENNPASYMLTEVVRSLLPVIESAGIATEAEVDIDSLQQRLENDILAGGGVAISPSLIGAWTKVI